MYDLRQWSQQESLVDAMLKPDFYPKPAAEIAHKETHISHLFFVGDLVYKIKKPVSFSFLDYSTLAKRRQFLNKELRLNRRLAPSVYLGVLPIALDEFGWRLGGSAEPAEYTLVMRRLPEKRMLPFLLDTGQVDEAMMRDLAGVLADFHARAECWRSIDPTHYMAQLRSQWYENLADLEPYLDPVNRGALRGLKNFGLEFFATHSELLKRRVIDGWVRDVHGDLHGEHICFAPEGIQIFDCIEFSDALRRIDLAAEIAFLLMDLSVRGGALLRAPFLTRYGERLGDEQRAQLLPFFETYRALVRAKVHVLREKRWNDQAARYFSFAQRVTWSCAEPFLLMICGLTGSGKSTLARALSERLGVSVINSDVVRKKLTGQNSHRVVPPDQDIYSPTTTERTYSKMARKAEKQVTSGKGVILDATFGRRALREKIALLAERYGIPLAVIHCSAPEPTTARRLRDRAAQGTDISDGRWEIYVAQKAAYEPMEELPAAAIFELDTSASVAAMVAACEPFLRSRLLVRTTVA